MRSIIVLSVCFLVMVRLPSVQAASFQGLGWPSDSGTFRVTTISGDGSTVIGYGPSDVFRWTRQAGMVAVPNSAGGFPLAASYDGSVIVGTTGSWAPYSPTGYGSFIWSNGGKTTILPQSTMSAAMGVTADGQFVVGATRLPTSYQAWSWQGGVQTNLSGLLSARGVSGDGSVIAASRRQTGPGGQTYGEACFLQNGAVTGLGTLTPGNPGSTAMTISADGRVVVGQSNSSTMSGEAFRWSQETGIIGLGGPAGWSGSQVQSNAWDVSADGGVVVGGAIDFATEREEAIIWDAVHGTRTVHDALVNEYGLDLTGWQIVIAKAVSDDGLTIAGDGIGPDGRKQPWVAVLPEPASLALVAPALFLVGRARRASPSAWIG